MVRKVLAGLYVLGLAACDVQAPECNGDVTYITENLTQWMQGSVSDKYTVQVVGLSDFYELKDSPLLLGTTLYDNMKGCTICSVTAKVLVTDNTGRNFTDEIDVRYQLTTTVPNEEGAYMSGIRMSGHDASEMRDSLWEKIGDNF